MEAIEYVLWGLTTFATGLLVYAGLMGQHIILSRPPKDDKIRSLEDKLEKDPLKELCNELNYKRTGNIMRTYENILYK